MSVSIIPGETDVEGAAAAVLTPYNLSRLRLDTWNRLRDAVRRLRGKPEDLAEVESLRRASQNAFDTLSKIEIYSAFPGFRTLQYLIGLFEAERYMDLSAACVRIVRMLSTDSFRRLDLNALRATDILDLLRRADGAIDKLPMTSSRPYFELLVVDDIGPEEEDALRLQLRSLRHSSDDFVYEIVLVRTFEDALLAVLANPNIEACVLRFSFPFPAPSIPTLTARIFSLLGEDRDVVSHLMPGQRTSVLGDLMKRLRPELDLFRVTSAPIEAVAGGRFRRVYYQSEDLHDLHLSVLKGVHDRFQTPFFDALREYSERPTGMFHALPVSRARSVTKSHWIEDYGNFYGSRLFLAETSATTGGLDSLLQPTGSLKQAQKCAARAFGADRTFFVTNGTSTANKIVTQALCRPGDIVLLSHDCHKSHPYAAILGGASPVYLDAYPLTDYSMYGGVTLREIKKQLFELKRAGKLHKVRLLLLTNITFDGITYDPYRVMKEVLAIKPDILFLWDEAWFAYGRFSPILRSRTAMDAAARLDAEIHSEHYRVEYDAWSNGRAHLSPDDASTFLDHSLMPDPELVRLRVYATQSTHKTLTALRQGSMIHVRDVDFEREAKEPFHAAYMTHTSTSPNYQILASLDAGRRQVELEGYDLVSSSLEMAFTLREQINEDPLLSRYFRALSPAEMIPAEHRPSGIQRYFDPAEGVGPIESSWTSDEFVLDPTRVTLHVGRTGLDGDTFRKLLMDEHDIHINKTSRNTVLFLIHIGMTRGTIAQLLKTLSKIVSELDRQASHSSEGEHAAFDESVRALTEQAPALPNFSRFHDAFKPDPGGTTPEGDIRRAFFQSYETSLCEFVPLDTVLKDAVASGAEFVSAGFVTPYPPGFPVLVPGQVISEAILDYLLALDVKEIHGYEPELGLRVFTNESLKNLSAPASESPRVSTKRIAENAAKTIEKPFFAPRAPGATTMIENNQPEVLRGLSDIRRHFYRNEVPTFFISATNYNLIGMEEWVKNFHFINYIDCFDGQHPNVFVPPEIFHRPFTSIEDINNYLLEHKAVIDFIDSFRKDGVRPRAVFLFFDERTEELCKELEIDIFFPRAELRRSVDDKLSTTRIGNQAGIESVPNVLAKVESYADLVEAAQSLGTDWVVQTAFGDSGHTTFFISSEEEYQRYAEEIAEAPEVKIMKRIRCRGSAMEACVTKRGTVCGPLMTELVGFPELTPYKGGWSGNEVLPEAFSQEVRDQARMMTAKFGDELRKLGYRGYFELDFLRDLDTDQLYLGELNPRITGASAMTNLAAFAHADVPLFLFHLLEWSDIDFELDIEALNERWADPSFIDAWGQLVMKHTGDEVRLITEAPQTGVYALSEDGTLEFIRTQTHRRTVGRDDRAFFLRIAKAGDYFYEGADLGILVTPGRLMTEDFELNEQAKSWIAGIRSAYQSEPVKAADLEITTNVAEAGNFKIL